MNNDKVIVY